MVRSAAAVDTLLYRFDMGAPDSPVKVGYTRITPDDVYDASRGYGWRRKPASSFDRPKSRCKAQWYQEFWGARVVGEETYFGEPVDDLWRDGVADRRDIVFMVDLPDGLYDVFVTVGDEEWTRLDMNVAAEDSVVCEDVRTWIFWGAYPAHRRLMFRTEVKDRRLDIRFFNHGKDIPITLDTVETVHEVLNSVLAVEIRRYVPPRMSLHGGRLDVAAELDSPELRRGFDFFSKGKYDRALEIWEKIDSERYEEILGILYGWVAGVVPRDGEIELLDRAVETLERAARRFPGDMSILQVLERTRDFRDGLLIYRGEKTREFLDPNAWIYRKRYALSGKDMLLRSTPDEPFYLKGRFEVARKTYWNLRESGGTDRKGLDRRRFVVETMEMVLAEYPGFDLAKIYLGRKVPWGKDYAKDPGKAPRWAALAREVLSRQHAVVRWWVDHQAPDGSMGGDQSFGDDVEMLRSWPGVVLATDDEAVRESVEKIADGVYTYIAPDGYNKGIWDVQHSAEPTGDPAFIVRFDYGDPVHVERGFRFMELFRDLFTGVNSRGHRHFKSIMMGAEGIVETPPFACDTHYHVRAAKPGLWAMWYSGLPEAVELFTQWADAWCEDAMRTDRGKPRGVMPSAVSFETDRIGGFGPEDDWKVTGSGYTYYDWSPNHSRLYDFLYTMWRVTGRDRYLEPMFLAPMPSTVVTWFTYTGDVSRNDIIKDAGGAYGRFLTTGDTGVLEETLVKTLELLRYNFPLMTGEVTMTDRINIGDTSVIHGMYTGGIPASGLPYTLGAVSWVDTGSDFAALVREHSPGGLRLSVYSFYDAERNVGIRFWDLERGSYTVRMGVDSDDDGFIDGPAETGTFVMDKRGDVFRFVLPPGKLLSIEVRQDEKHPPPGSPLPDIAFTRRDVDFARGLPVPGHGTALSVLVHNIGGKHTGPFSVMLGELTAEGEYRLIDSVRFPGLEAAHDFVPKTEPIALAGYVSAKAERLVVEADPADEIDEIYEGNNRVEMPLRR